MIFKLINYLEPFFHLVEWQEFSSALLLRQLVQVVQDASQLALRPLVTSRYGVNVLVPLVHPWFAVW